MTPGVTPEGRHPARHRWGVVPLAQKALRTGILDSGEQGGSAEVQEQRSTSATALGNGAASFHPSLMRHIGRLTTARTTAWSVSLDPY